MKDLINLAVAKLNERKKVQFRTNFICSSFPLDSLKQTKSASNLSPAESYENTFANLNLVDGIYCKDSLGNLIPVKIDFNTNIVLPELI